MRELFDELLLPIGGRSGKRHAALVRTISALLDEAEAFNRAKGTKAPEASGGLSIRKEDGDDDEGNDEEGGVECTISSLRSPIYLAKSSPPLHPTRCWSVPASSLSKRSSCESREGKQNRLPPTLTPPPPPHPPPGPTPPPPPLFSPPPPVACGPSWLKPQNLRVKGVLSRSMVAGDQIFLFRPVHRLSAVLAEGQRPCRREPPPLNTPVAPAADAP